MIFLTNSPASQRQTLYIICPPSSLNATFCGAAADIQYDRYPGCRRTSLLLCTHSIMAKPRYSKEPLHAQTSHARCRYISSSSCMHVLFSKFDGGARKLLRDPRLHGVLHRMSYLLERGGATPDKVPFSKNGCTLQCIDIIGSTYCFAAHATACMTAEFSSKWWRKAVRCHMSTLSTYVLSDTETGLPRSGTGGAGQVCIESRQRLSTLAGVHLFLGPSRSSWPSRPRLSRTDFVAAHHAVELIY
jgi:hypothetical protein